MLSEDGDVFWVVLGRSQSLHRCTLSLLSIWGIKHIEVKYIEQCHIGEILLIMSVTMIQIFCS